MSTSFVSKVPIKENGQKAHFGPLLRLKPLVIAHIEFVLI